VAFKFVQSLDLYLDINLMKLEAPGAQNAHPAAPAELKQSFAEFLKRSRNSQTQTASTAPAVQNSNSRDANEENGLVYQEFWEAPARYWKPRVHELSEDEIDAVLVRILSLLPLR
jgi:hypothetical protein